MHGKRVSGSRDAPGDWRPRRPGIGGVALWATLLLAAMVVAGCGVTSTGPGSRVTPNPERTRPATTAPGGPASPTTQPGAPPSTTTAPGGPPSTTTTPGAPTGGAAHLLKLGARGSAVSALQSRLAALTYLPSSAVDGVFGMRTWHAVVAFQGWSRLAMDGVVGPVTRGALADARPPRPWSRVTGIEVHLDRQVLLLISRRRVVRAIHVSSGAPGHATPLGHYAIFARQVMSWSKPFQVWMPLAQYFSGGYAIHEFASVPAYPASHGCVRVPSQEARTVWDFGRLGMRVWTVG